MGALTPARRCMEQKVPNLHIPQKVGTPFCAFWALSYLQNRVLMPRKCVPHPLQPLVNCRGRSVLPLDVFFWKGAHFNIAPPPPHFCRPFGSQISHLCMHSIPVIYGTYSQGWGIHNAHYGAHSRHTGVAQQHFLSAAWPLSVQKNKL